MEPVSNLNVASTSGNHCEIKSLPSESETHQDVTVHNVNLELIGSSYEAAVKGKTELFKEMPSRRTPKLSPMGNTALHINIANQNGTKESITFVKEILDKFPSLLCQVNARRETPLHVAAKYGHSNIVKVLIDRAKTGPTEPENGDGADVCRQMLRMTNQDENTALHEAARYNSFHVAKLLTKEDPDFNYSANKCSKSALYIAAERGYFKVVVEILGNCTSAGHGGPNGKTALHAAVMSANMRATDTVSHFETTRKILERRTSLTKEIDDNGWTPLHYAAYYGRMPHLVPLLLKYDVSAAYIRDINRGMTPLHMAASQGYVRTMQKIILHCPECCELVDKREWNVLHFAMAGLRDASQLKSIFLENPLLKNLMDETDVNGNTPLHVLAAACYGDQYNTCMDVLFNFRCDLFAINKQHFSVEDVFEHGSPQLEEEILKLSTDVDGGVYPRGIVSADKLKDRKVIINELTKTLESHLVVVALIATVTFSAAFTLPGGYKSGEHEDDRGTAILSKSSAFQAFVIADVIAMILSISAVFVHFLMSTKFFHGNMFLFEYAFNFAMVAMIATVVAFVTGIYAVLSPSLGLALATCFIGLGFFLFVFRVIRRLDF